MTRRGSRPFSPGSWRLAVERAQRRGRPPACRAPIGVGISSPGPLDPWRGVILAPPNLGWHDSPARRRASPRPRPADLSRARHERGGHGRVAVRRRAADVATRSTSRSRPVSGAASSSTAARSSVRAARPARSATSRSISTAPCAAAAAMGHVEAIASGTALARAARELLDGGVDEDSPLARLAADGARGRRRSSSPGRQTRGTPSARRSSTGRGSPSARCAARSSTSSTPR